MSRKLSLILSTLVALLFTGLAVESRAQVASAVVVPTCGSVTYTAGKSAATTQDTTGKSCSSATFGSSVTISGFAASASTGASGTVTAGGVYQTVFAANSTRKGCTIQNPTTQTEDLNIRVGGTTVYGVPAGSYFQCGFPGGVTSSLIEVSAATTGHPFNAGSN